MPVPARRFAAVVTAPCLVLALSGCITGTNEVSGGFAVEGGASGGPPVIRHVSCDDSPASATYLDLVELDPSVHDGIGELPIEGVLWKVEAESGATDVADFTVGTTPDGFVQTVALNPGIADPEADLAVRIGRGNAYQSYIFRLQEVRPGRVRSGLSWNATFDEWRDDWVSREC